MKWHQDQKRKLLRRQGAATVDGAEFGGRFCRHPRPPEISKEQMRRELREAVERTIALPPAWILEAVMLQLLFAKRRWSSAALARRLGTDCGTVERAIS